MDLGVTILSLCSGEPSPPLHGLGLAQTWPHHLAVLSGSLSRQGDLGGQGPPVSRSCAQVLPPHVQGVPAGPSAPLPPRGLAPLSWKVADPKPLPGVRARRPRACGEHQ
jgi:hypothetical protein